MAVLQAARAHVLGLPVELSLSWGLNRAIFYAAAKRGFKARPEAAYKRHSSVKERPIEERPEVFYLGDEMAYKKELDGKTYFTIGGEVQDTEGFEKQIQKRFGARFAVAWEQALAFMKQHTTDELLSQKVFYERVYKPNRDEFVKKWRELGS